MKIGCCDQNTYAPYLEAEKFSKADLLFILMSSTPHMEDLEFVIILCESCNRYCLYYLWCSPGCKSLHGKVLSQWMSGL